MSCRPPAPALNEQRRRSRHADHWIGYPPRLRRGGRLGRGRAQTARAHRHAPPSSRSFRKEAFEGGRGRRRGDRKRVLGRGGDRTACQESCDRESKTSAHHRPCEDQDRYDRRQRPRSTLCKRLSAGSLDSGRADSGASPASDPAQSERPTAIAIEEYHSVDPAQPLDPLLPARRSVRGERTGMAFSPGLAGGRTPCRRTASARVRSARRGPQSHRARSCPLSPGGRGRQTPDDNPRGRHGGGARHRGRDRRRGTLRAVAEAGELPWPQPECAPIGSRARAYHGRITKQGRGHARGMLVEAAWAAARAPGPLRAFFLRVRARRGQHVAAVATARKLAVLIWHLLSKDESYVWARPALHARKLRDLELKAGYKAERGQRGAAHAYNIKSHRDQERRWVEQAETAYARFVSGWNPRGPKRVRTGAATEVRR